MLVVLVVEVEVKESVHALVVVVVTVVEVDVLVNAVVVAVVDARDTPTIRRELDALVFPRGRSLINRSKLVVAQFPTECVSVFQRVALTGGARNGNHVFIFTQKPVKGDLTDTLSPLLCNRLEDLLKGLFFRRCFPLPTCRRR